MPTAKVYSPVSGLVLGEARYPNGQPHTIINDLGGGCCPIDIASAAGTPIYLIGNGRVKSIRTSRRTRCCRNAPDGWWTHGVLVRVYRDEAGTEAGYLGSVGYAHIANPLPDGHYRGNYHLLGHLPPDMCADPVGQRQCRCGTGAWCCSNGVHIHMQAKDNEVIGVTYLDRTDKHTYRGKSTLFKWHY